MAERSMGKDKGMKKKPKTAQAKKAPLPPQPTVVAPKRPVTETKE